MSTKLFVSPQEIQQTTIMGGNVDIDKFQFCIESVMITILEPMLGSELYDKILLNFTNDTLTGDYLTIFDKFVKPITKFESTAQYINIAQYSVTNGGIFKHSPDAAEVVSKEEVQSLASVYHNNAQVYVMRFNKWITLNEITEYKTQQNGVDANKNIGLVAGWYFGRKNKEVREGWAFDSSTGDWFELD